jgi:CHAD domain-containing protein
MRTVARYLDDVARLSGLVADKPTPAAVHDLRVATRRATEALRLFAPADKSTRRDLRKLRQLAAPVRDRDVTRALLLRHGLPIDDPALAYLQGQRDLAAQQLQTFCRRRQQL